MVGFEVGVAFEIVAKDKVFFLCGAEGRPESWGVGVEVMVV